MLLMRDPTLATDIRSPILALPTPVRPTRRALPLRQYENSRLMDGADQQRLVAAYMQRAGFRDIAMNASLPLDGDPLWTVVGVA